MLEKPTNQQDAIDIEDAKMNIPNFEAMVDKITIEKYLADGDNRIKATPEQREYEKNKMKIFADAIGDCTYYIGGGLAVELEKGDIEHVHNDIDIIVFDDELDKIRETLESKGFIFEKSKSFGGHNYDARLKSSKDNEELTDDSLHIGIFLYKKNNENNMAEQLNENGDINKIFPLEYFNAERQMVEFDRNKLCIADIRVVLGNKLASERPKDLEDIKQIKELILDRYPDKEVLREEMDKLQSISQKNIRTKTFSGIQNIISGLMRKKDISHDNIYTYFEKEVKKAADRIKNDEYRNVINEYLERLKNFSSDDKYAGKTFEEFALENTEPLFRYYDDEIKFIIDSIFER